MAEWARRIEGEFIPSDRPNENIFLFRKPIGVVAGILPWNFPFFLIARKVAPVLIVGNTVVIEPSEETPNNAFEFADVVDEIGLLPGVFNLVFGRGQTTRQALSESAQIDMISFTGSVETGSKIMAAAAKNITKIKLELGGKAPAIVMPDVILICNCAERIYVHENIAARFTERMRQSEFGNPLVDSDLDYGPLINAQGLEKVERLVETAIKERVKVETGGKRADTKNGFYYEPTVLSECLQGI